MRDALPPPRPIPGAENIAGKCRKIPAGSSTYVTRRGVEGSRRPGRNRVRCDREVAGREREVAGREVGVRGREAKDERCRVRWLEEGQV